MIVRYLDGRSGSTVVSADVASSTAELAAGRSDNVSCVYVRVCACARVCVCVCVRVSVDMCECIKNMCM